MLKIKHRINTVEQLDTVPQEYGIELDVRYHNNDLVLHHDPFNHHRNTPCKFEDFLKHYKHAIIIVNVKTEGIEDACIAMLEKYKVKNWFFLDLSMPFFVKYAKYKNIGKEHLCARFSQHEAIEYALGFSGAAGWVWADCFDGLPLSKENFDTLKKHFKVCLVSPELQAFPTDNIKIFKQKAFLEAADAVCTKKPDLW